MKELEVGESCEVMEVLDNVQGFPELKKVQGLVEKEFDSSSNGYYLKFREVFTNVDPYLYKSEVKPVGRLTVTKVK